MLYNIDSQSSIRGLSGKSPAIVNKHEWFMQHQYNLAAKESELECISGNNYDSTGLGSGDQQMPLSELVYCVAVTYKMTE